MAKISKILFVLFVSLAIIGQEKRGLDLKLSTKQLPFGLTKLESEYDPKVYLSLSGGGARAVSQLGVLKAFEENDIRFDGIVGTSMGSIIGGLYSAGYSLNQLDSQIVRAPWDEFFTLEQTSRKELFPDQKITEDKAILSLRLDGFEPLLPTAINTGQQVANYLNLLTLNAPLNTVANFDEFLYLFNAVSTNLLTGEPHVLGNGSLSIAMRASSSVSLVLAPVKIDSLILVDGGLVANNPVSIAKQHDPDFIIAVDASSPLRDNNELKYPWEIADQLVSIPMKVINEEQLKLADLILRPDVEGKKNTDFSELRALIDLGYNSAIQSIDRIHDDLTKLYLNRISPEEKIIKNLFVKSNSEEVESYFKFLESEELSEREVIYHLTKFPNLNSYSKFSAFLEKQETQTELYIRAVPNQIIDNIIIERARLIDSDSLLAKVIDLKNNPFNGEKILNSLLEILREYRKQGYSLTRIRNVDFNDETLRIVIDEQTINSIEVRGNEKTNSEIITRELPFNEGDYFINTAIEQGLVNLRSTNLFESVELKIEQHGTYNNLIVEVIERPSLLLRFGLRIDTEYFTQASLDLREENLFGTGTEFGTIFTGGIRNQSIAIQLRSNRIFDTFLTYNIRGFYDALDIRTYIDDTASTERKFIRSKSGEYTESHFGGSIGIGAQLEKIGNLMFEGRYHQDKISGLETFPEADEYSTNISSIRLALSIDSQNKYPFPTTGVAFNGFYETAQSALGGDIGYSKLFFEYSSFFPMNSFHNLNLRLKFGFADQTLPLSQQFSFGGQSSFFGYRDYEFRGRQIFISSLAYRVKLPFKIFFDTYLKARYDLGSIWTQKEEIKFKNLRHGIGASIALDTPIGPAEFSAGKSFLIKKSLPKNIISWGETHFYFTIGYYY